MAPNKFITTIDQHQQSRQKHIRSQKFMTTPKQHKVRKAYYNLRQGFPKKAGVVPEWWNARLAKDPYLYHKTGEDNVSNILKEGLYPYDAQENPVGTQYADDQELTPRPGHVYLADGNKINAINYEGPSEESKLRIDMRKLDPQKLFADEDAYAFTPPHGWNKEDEYGEPLYPEQWTEIDPTNKVPREKPIWNSVAKRVINGSTHNMLTNAFGEFNWSPQREAWQVKNPKADIAQAMHQAIGNDPSWPSYGHWANDVLNEPEHTRYSLDRNQTIAYNGAIPHHAIECNLLGKWRNPYATGEITPEQEWEQQSQQLMANPEGQGEHNINYMNTLTEPNPWGDHANLDDAAAADDPDYQDAIQRAAAVDPNWLSEYINRNGPYLYHGTGTQEAQESIMRDGLYPHDKLAPGEKNFEIPMEPGEIREYPEDYEPATSRSQWTGQYLEPRAGHVYLGTASRAGAYARSRGGMVAVDMRKLDPSKMNADEDSFQSDQLQWRNGEADENHPVNRTWEFDPPPEPPDYSGDEPRESLGGWADRIGLGNRDVQETHHSLTNHGSIAYNGTVPPEAIMPGSTYAEVKDQNRLPYNWEPDEWDMQQPHMQRAAAVGNELHVSLKVPRAVGSEILRWVKDQKWPEGTEIEALSEYHITVLYSPEGYEQKDAWWIQHIPHAEIKFTGIDTFPSGEREGLNAIVLKVDSPELVEHSEELQATAEHMGLEIKHFDGGYKPHVTVAYSPGRAPEGLKPPPISFAVGPSEVSSPRYKEEKTATLWGANLKEWPKGNMGYDGRRPTIYEPTTNTLHVGPKGSTHYDVQLQMQQPSATLESWPRGWTGPNPEAYPHPDYLSEQNHDPARWDTIENRGQPNEHGWYRYTPQPPPHVQPLMEDLANRMVEVPRQQANPYGHGQGVMDTLRQRNRLGMAADPYWLDNYIERNGPYLHHRTDAANVSSILQNGILPWDHPANPSEPQDTGMMTPRPGHTYMRQQDPELMERYEKLNPTRKHVQIDMRKLDPTLMNPDEDNIAGSPPSQRIWGIPHPDDTDSANWGQWAEDHDLTHPSQTAWSLDRPTSIYPGTMAYNGPIPPEAVSMPGSQRIAYAPDEAQGLDDLSIKAVAHQLHYEWAKGKANPAFMQSYARRLLKMLGYPDDDITAQAAIQAWQQMYPTDKVVDPMDKSLELHSEPQQEITAAEKVLDSKNLRNPQAIYVKDWDNPDEDADSTEPTPVNNPEDNWGAWGTDTDGEKPHPGIVVGK
jgi:2'-5' RNA ligase